MLIVVSPAKKLDMEPTKDILPTEPVFAEHARELAAVADKLSLDELQKLMGLSPSLAHLNAQRFGAFGKQRKKPAALAFAGDTYRGLDAASLDPHEMAWAQDHLRILSGLYGLLRPLDAIEPYRLEMGSRLHNEKGKTLYAYWGSELADALNKQAATTGAAALVNCASQEYFGAVDKNTLKIPVISPVFKERKNGKEKIVSFFAKRARGAMARFAIQHRITTPSGLMEFKGGGYEFKPGQSDAQTMVFVRDHPVTA